MLGHTFTVKTQAVSVACHMSDVSSCQDQAWINHGKFEIKVTSVCLPRVCPTVVVICKLMCGRYGTSYGNIHFILMSTEHDWSKGSDQAVYLEQHLSSVDRSQTPWLVFAGHR